MMTIFIDSGPFRGVNTPKDQYFSKAKKGFATLFESKVKLITTDYIIDESYTGILTNYGYQRAMDFDAMVKQSHIKIVFIGKIVFDKALEVFRRYNKDKEWSFTDCTSYVVMKELSIKKVFTFDKNFAEMGFELL